MMKLLEKYNDIMLRYRNGDFCSENLTMGKILEIAGEPDLFEKMDLSEIQFLIDASTGFTKSMFCTIKEQKIKKIQKMDSLEKELIDYKILDYSEDNDFSGTTLAKNLKLDVQYCDTSDLPKDVEAKLSPTNKDSFNGTIMILNNSAISKFSFIHEIMHYIRDVGVGNRVIKEYTRKSKGNTESNEEQEINYLTAALVMPIQQIASDLDEFEGKVEFDDDFWSKMMEKYDQTKEAIMRRFIEVRNIIDYRNHCI